VLKYASQEKDKWSLEQYRPYVLMMNTRAKASMALRQDDFDVALRHLEEGIIAIERLIFSHKETVLPGSDTELSFLKSWAEQIRKSRPLTFEEELNTELEAAIEREDYEAAARLRDQIQDLKKQQPRH
jgi:excinuclease UvrABC helicase subunit UvrB